MAPLQIASFWEPRSIYFHYGVVVDSTPFPKKNAQVKIGNLSANFGENIKTCFVFWNHLVNQQKSPPCRLVPCCWQVEHWIPSLHYTKKTGATWVRWVVYFGGWDPFTKLSNFEVDAGEVVVISRGPWQKKWEMLVLCWKTWNKICSVSATYQLRSIF